MKYELLLDGAKHSVELIRLADDPSRLTALIDGRPVEGDAVQISSGVYSILLAGRSFETRIEALTDCLLVQTAGNEYRVEIVDPRSWRRGRGGRMDLAGHQQVCAPMAGKVVRVLVTPGQQVEAGQGLFVVEAMKMQNEIRAPKTGKVEQLLAEEGRAVNTGEVLAVVG